MNIIVAGGGTGGHLVPALAVSDVLKSRGARVLVVGSNRPEEKQLAEQAGFEFQSIPSGKLRRYFSLQNLADVPKVLAGYRASRKIIKEFKPDVVFAKGGYVALPMIRAAAKANVPVVLHESDTVPGLANRLGSKRAQAVAVSWPPETIVGLPKEKMAFTGNPVRPGVLKGKAAKAEQAFSLDPMVPTLLVLGGSQGSLALNELVTKALPELLEEFQVVHQVGDRSAAEITDIQQKLPANLRQRYHVRGFFGEELFDLYAAATLVLSRAGAGVLAEVAVAGKPMVLLPLPSAAGDHQRRNAAVFAEQGAATVLEEGETKPEDLVREVKKLVHDSSRLTAMGRAAHALAQPQAAQSVADLVWKAGNGQ